MRHILLTLSACLAFAAGYAEKPVKGAHLRLENATYNFGDVPRKGGDLVREFRFVNDGTAPLVHGAGHHFVFVPQAPRSRSAPWRPPTRG